MISLNLFFIAAIILLGASFGSFINVLIDRLPRKQSIVLPASHCSSCGKPIPFYLNIPILSYLILRGRCRFCGAGIHIHHLLVEIITPMVMLVLYWTFSSSLSQFAKYSTLFLFLIPIFFIDIYHRLILDKLTIPLAVTGLGFALLPNTDISFPEALMTGVVILALLLLIAWLFEKVRHKEGMGGGDIKLLAGLATYLGAFRISFVVFFASVLAVLTAVFISRSRKEGVPFGPFLVVSTFLWLLFGNSFWAWYKSILMPAY